MFFFPKINLTFLKSIKSSNKRFNLCLDKDYCIIEVKHKIIIFSYFRPFLKNKNQYYQINFYSYSADVLCNLINQHNGLARSISLSHALYIGQEIYKAELSIILFQQYIQQ